jgi:hypothetical protein
MIIAEGETSNPFAQETQDLALDYYSYQRKPHRLVN